MAADTPRDDEGPVTAEDLRNLFVWVDGDAGHLIGLASVLEEG